MKPFDLSKMSDIDKAMFVQDIVCDLLGVDVMPLTGDELGGLVSEGSISCPAQPLTCHCKGLEVVFYKPLEWNECLHRGVVIDYEDGIVDIEWRSAVMDMPDSAEGDCLVSDLHMYESCSVAAVQ